MKYWDVMDKEEKGIFLTFESEYEAQKWLENQTKRFPQYVKSEGMHIVEAERPTMYERYQAQQKEIEQLKLQNMNLLRACEHRMQNNQMLKAQNIAYREALERIVSPIEFMQKDADNGNLLLDGHAALKLLERPSYYQNLAKKALSTEPIDYYNPKDIETLKQAKKALEMAWNENDSVDWLEAQEKGMETIKAIDNAIRGGQ